MSASPGKLSRRPKTVKFDPRIRDLVLDELSQLQNATQIRRDLMRLKRRIDRIQSPVLPKKALRAGGESLVDELSVLSVSEVKAELSLSEPSFSFSVAAHDDDYDDLYGLNEAEILERMERLEANGEGIPTKIWDIVASHSDKEETLTDLFVWVTKQLLAKQRAHKQESRVKPTDEALLLELKEARRRLRQELSALDDAEHAVKRCDDTINILAFAEDPLETPFSKRFIGSSIKRTGSSDGSCVIC